MMEFQSGLAGLHRIELVRQPEYQSIERTLTVLNLMLETIPLAIPIEHAIPLNHCYRAVRQWQQA